MVKLGFTGLALAGCLALASCNSTGGLRLPSAFDYPEANAYVDCMVAQTRKRTLAKGRQLTNDDALDLSVGGWTACQPIENTFRSKARASGLSDNNMTKVIVELRTRAGDRALDEFLRIRLAQLKAEGKIR